MAWRLFSVSQAQDNRPHTLCEADLFAPSPDYGPWRNSIPLRAVSVKGHLAAVWRKMRTFGYKLSARHACSHHHLCYLCLVGPCCPSRQGRQSHFRIQHSIRKRKREIQYRATPARHRNNCAGCRLHAAALPAECWRRFSLYFLRHSGCHLHSQRDLVQYLG